MLTHRPSTLIPLCFSLLCFPGLASLSAQESTQTAAEKQFHAAFWQETGRGELNIALRGYLAAAAAKGPETTRAQALLRAAMLQHRLQKSTDAEKTLQQLFRRFPSQKAVIADGERRLDEWRRIDLRRNYSDWYKEHLFRPEIQAKILEHLQALSRIQAPKRRTRKELDQFKNDLAAIEREILVYGQGAVPALMEMAKTGVSSGNSDLTERANRLIFLIGRLPPVAALLENSQWLEEERAWRTVFHINAQERQLILAGVGQRLGYVPQLLAASAAGPANLIEILGGEIGGTFAKRKSRGLSAVLKALHKTADPKLTRQLMQLSEDAEVPVLVREAIERAIAAYGIPDASAAEWVDWSKDRLLWDSHTKALRNAAQRIRKSDGKILDRLFSTLESTPKDLRESVTEAVLYGLRENSRPLQIPWTEDRLYRFLQSYNSDSSSLSESIGFQWRTDAGRTMIAAAILRHPSKIEALLLTDASTVSSIFRDHRGDERDGLLERQWSREVARQIQQRWGEWPFADRVIAIRLICTTHLLDRCADVDAVLYPRHGFTLLFRRKKQGWCQPVSGCRCQRLAER